MGYRHDRDASNLDPPRSSFGTSWNARTDLFHIMRRLPPSCHRHRKDPILPLSMTEQNRTTRKQLWSDDLVDSERYQWSSTALVSTLLSFMTTLRDRIRDTIGCLQRSKNRNTSWHRDKGLVQVIACPCFGLWLGTRIQRVASLEKYGNVVQK